ncbi:hypothetical protein JZ751_005533 [Albula glossodonta]|uniref:Uridylate-specific endoribonuclease n=1 Tax=Albula glossodonta TaxID=121402 RepID=A0A8T2N5B1_9TELE|nr:hypothetical protein JZ751_005533 [Albula glossodonta]
MEPLHVSDMRRLKVVCNQPCPNVNEELSKILNELWKLDVNRLKAGKDYTISLQRYHPTPNTAKQGCSTPGPEGHRVCWYPLQPSITPPDVTNLADPKSKQTDTDTVHCRHSQDPQISSFYRTTSGKAGFVEYGSNNARDRARAPLFSYVNEDKLKSLETYAHFINLLDNYEMSTGKAEMVTSEELMEERLFLDSIMETEVMKSAHRYLASKGQSSTDPDRFKTQLYDIWFRLYHRDRSGGMVCFAVEDSAVLGFVLNEKVTQPGGARLHVGVGHVFVGETRQGREIMGFHNWVQFYLQEKHGNVDYKGYRARDKKDMPDEDDHVLNLQFSWKGLVKPVGSSFIGVSPEFEVALFTIVFLISNDKVTNVIVQVDEYHLEVVVYRYGRSIGTSYPKLLTSNNRPL